jgi:hypothetical protein
VLTTILPAIMPLLTLADCAADGEGFNYDDASADYWLTEISGLALGLPSDMLRYAGDLLVASIASSLTV